MADTEELAEGYTIVNDTQYDAGLFLLRKLGIAPGARVLNVGCGTGNLTAHIAEIVGENGSVAGIDPSKERIATSLKIAISKVSFYEGRAEDLSMFNSASFDAVFVNSTFHWVEDQHAAMKEFARVLKPGGLLGISGGSGDYVAAHEKIKAEVLARDPYCIYPETIDPKFLKKCELEDLLTDAGFFKRKIITNTIIKSAKNAEAMIQCVGARTGKLKHRMHESGAKPSLSLQDNGVWCVPH